ncbi:MAG TPA: DMT family transporter [Acidimicrobiia bacterium]|nr:DMT family transporter [Acidimicrobiia bacterium]
MTAPTIQTPNHRLTLAAALSGAVMISFSAIFFELSGVTPSTGAFYRAAYALPVLFVLWMLRRARDRRRISRRWIGMGAGLALGADIVSWHGSIDFIGAGLATLLANTQVIFVALGAWIFLGERPRRTTLAAIPVILIGVSLVSGVGQGDAFGIDPVRGTLLALLAATFYATFILGFRQSNDEQAPAAGPLLEATVGATGAALVIGLVTGDVTLGLSWPSHGWLIALALDAQVAGWLLIGYALPRLPAVETATIVLLQPALTMVWGALIFSERPSALQIAGAVVVLTGVTFVAMIRARREKPVPVS